MATNMNSREVIEKLKIHLPKERGFVFLEQVANTTGFASRFADAIVLNVWKSRFEIIGVEVKVSRSDWLNEIRQPAKADKIFQYCDTWYVATPAGIIQPGELPNGWGWWEVTAEKTFTRQASDRNKHKTLDDFFVAAVLRRALEQATPQAELENAETRGYHRGVASGKESAQYKLERLQTELDRLKKCVQDYETASGLNFSQGWADGANLGRAVNMVLRGEHLQLHNRLRSVRTFIDEALGTLEKPKPNGA